MSTNHVQSNIFSDGEIRLATSNYEAQEWLTRELHSAFLVSGMNVSDLARSLDLSLEEAEEWLSGDRDLTMSELRHLATAIDAHVTFHVEAGVNRVPEWLASLDGVAWASGNAWSVSSGRMRA